MKCRLSFAFAALLFPPVASPAPAGQETAGPPPSYAKEIAPLVHSKCAGCHRPGQIGPMSLLNYEEVRPWVKSIKKTVAARTMPPWFADPAHGKFLNDNRMTDEEIALVTRWADAGAPAGDLSQAPPPPAFNDEGWSIGTPDQVFKMEPFHVGDEIEDDYEHFVIPSGLTEDKWAVAIEVKPGAARMVHHVLVFTVPESRKTVGDIGGPLMTGQFVTGWAPGTNAFLYREGFGKKIPAKCNIVLQVHYHKEPGAGTGGIDQSAFAVKYASGPVKHPTTTAWIMDPGLAIPPGAPNHEASAVFRFQDDGVLLGMVPHMHLRGKDFTYYAEYPDGTKETLLHVPKYDFNWQIGYVLEEPKRLPKGTAIRCVAHWDNSAGNPNNPDPSQTVYFSEATTDEMMIGFTEYAYDTQKDRQGRFGFPEGFDMNKLRDLSGRLEGRVEGRAEGRRGRRPDAVR